MVVALVVNRDIDVLLARFDQRLELVDHAVEHRLHGEGRTLERLLARVEPCQPEQVLHQPLHPAGMTGDDFEEPPRLRLLGRGVEQGLDVALNRGERRAQLVRDIGDEIAPHAIGAPEIGDVVEDEHGAARARRGDPRRPGHDALWRIVGEGQLLRVGGLAAEAAADLGLDVRVTNELEIVAPLRLVLQTQQPPGGVVGELDDALFVHDEDAFDHAGQDGAHAGPVARELPEAFPQRLDGSVQRPGNEPELIRRRVAGAGREVVPRIPARRPPRRGRTAASSHGKRARRAGRRSRAP